MIYIYNMLNKKKSFIVYGKFPYKNVYIYNINVQLYMCVNMHQA